MAEEQEEEVYLLGTFLNAKGKAEVEAFNKMKPVLSVVKEKGVMLRQRQGEAQPPPKLPRNASTSPSTKEAADEIAQCIYSAILLFSEGASDWAAMAAVDAFKEVSKAIEINKGLGNLVCAMEVLQECKMKVIDAATFRIQVSAALYGQEYHAALWRAYGGNIDPEQKSIMDASYSRVIHFPFHRLF